MRIVVIDASFVLCSILSPETKTALSLKELFKKQKAGEGKIYSPSFMPIEVSNGLRFTIKDKNLAEEIFVRFSLLPIEFFSLDLKQTQQVLSMAYVLGTTVYDTAYHLLAKLLGGEFYTCDSEYFQKAQKKGNIILFK